MFDQIPTFQIPSIQLPQIPGIGSPTTATPNQQPRPVLGTVWGYPGDSMDGGVTAWGVDLKGKDRNILGISLPLEGKNAVPLSKVPLGGLVDVFSSQTGRMIRLPRIDNGPAAWTGNGVDLTFNAARALGLDPREGKFAGLYVNPTNQTITKNQLGDYNYTGYGWIAPGATDAMKDAPNSPLDWTPPTGGASGVAAQLNPLSWLTVDTAEKFFVTAGFVLVVTILTVSLLQDKSPIAVTVDGAKSAGGKLKSAGAAIAKGAALA